MPAHTSQRLPHAYLFAPVILFLMLTGALTSRRAAAADRTIPAIERQALVDIYKATNGPGWKHQDKWLGDVGTECSWWGVFCNNDGTTVVAVNFTDNQLTGTIPPSIGNLRALERLILTSNQVSGEVPAEVWALTNLQTLLLDKNQLTGSIPTAAGDLTNLQSLGLSFNMLTGSIPAEIGNLKALQWLFLSGNLLTGPIPPTVGHLKNLQGLLLSSNQLTGSIPPEIGGLTNLLKLFLSENQLTGPIPDVIGNLKNVDTLVLSANQLSGAIPSGIGNLTNLQYLVLGGNQLSGPIPNGIGNLTNLNTLILSINQLNGTIPGEIGKLTKLQNLWLDSNKLSGSIPSGLGNLKELLDLRLHYNELTGPIPTTIGNLTRLTALNCYYNRLVGTIPVEVGNLSNLTLLSLGSNQLTGQIPSGIWNLSKLETLNLGLNQLTGTIPSTVGNLKSLDTLDLGSNQLEGTIPSTVGNLSNLTILLLFGNQLSGTIPSSVGNLARLKKLNLWANKLTGTIPKEIGNLHAIEELGLNENPLTGTIPPEIGRLTSLKELYLNGDQLTGPIPPEIGRLTNLKELSLSSNQLSGAIPGALSNLVNLDAGKLDIRWNALNTGDARLVGFLNSRQNGGDWKSTQTLAPGGVRAIAVGQDGLDVSWQPILYSADSGYYEVLVSASPEGPYSSAGMTTDKSTRALTLTGLKPADTFYCTVRTITLPHGNNKNTVTSENSPSVAGATAGSPSSLEPPNARPSANGATGLSFKVQAPVNYPWTAWSNAGWITLTSGTPGVGTGTVTYDVAANTGAARVGTILAAGQAFTVNQEGTCSVPAAPSFAMTQSSVSGGTPYFVSWTPTAPKGGAYRVETSRSTLFAAVESVQTTSATSALISTVGSTTTYDLYIRVKALQPCGELESPYSNSMRLTVTPAPAQFVFLTSPLSIVAASGEPAPSATVTLRNAGGTAGRIVLSSSADFPQPLVFDPPSLDIEPGATGTVTVQVPASLVSTPNTYAGNVTGTFDGGKISLGVRLAVLPMKIDPGTRPDLRATASDAVAHFTSLSGQNPAETQLVVTVSSVQAAGRNGRIVPMSSDPAYLQVSVSSGDWLRIGGVISQPVPASGVVTFPLSVDRSRRVPADGVSPFRTLLTITPVGATPGDGTASAVIEVIDTIPDPVETGRGEERQSPAASFIVPSIVNAAGKQGAQFTSDGWLRNNSSEAVPVDLYFTPAGTNGLTDPGVRKASITLPASTTRRLSNILRTTFGLEASGSSGPLHVLSPKLEALSLRVLTQAQTGGKPEFTFFNEIPSVLSGSGITSTSGSVAGGSLLVTGITEDASGRTNLLLAETSGQDVTATITLRSGAGGTPAGTGTVTVPSFGMTQISVASLLNGQTLKEGTAQIVVSQGGGTLRAAATKLDNCTNSFTTTVPAPIRTTSDSSDIVFPGIVRAAGQGTFFSTILRLANSSPSASDNAQLLLTLYNRDGQELAKKNVSIPGAYGTLTQDIVKFLLPNVTDADAIVGWLLITGETGRIAGGSFAEISAAVDPANPGGCRLSTPIDPIVMTEGPGQTAETYSRGYERSFAGVLKDDRNRNSLVLVETSGVSGCTVDLELRDRTGLQLAASKTVSLAPRRYLQIGDFVNSGQGFGITGLATFSDIVVTSTVTSSACRVVPFVTINNNVSKQPLVIPLSLAGRLEWPDSP